MTEMTKTRLVSLERERYEQIEADAHRYHMLRDLLIEHGCPWEDGCHAPTAINTWLLSLGSRRTASPPPEGIGPVRNREYYHPQEVPNRYPLELTPAAEICLWGESNESKWVLAYFRSPDGDDPPDLRWVGDRPLDPRVNWEHFRELCVQGYQLARRLHEVETR